MIDEVTSGSLAKNGKLNEVIRYLNSIINTHVEISDLGDGSPDRPGFHITQDQSLLVIPEAEEGGGGGVGADGFEIIWQDGTSSYYSFTDALANYDPDNDAYWSIAFAVSSNAFTKSVSYDSNTSIYDATGSSQTVYRLRLISDENSISVGGQYREVTICQDGEPIQSLIKIA
jgi:hypothetical protein